MQIKTFSVPNKAICKKLARCKKFWHIVLILAQYSQLVKRSSLIKRFRFCGEWLLKFFNKWVPIRQNV